MSTPKQVAAATETDQTDPEVITPYVEADLLADTEQELLEAATAPPKVSAADATTAAMLRIAESMEKMMLRQEAVRPLNINEVAPVSPFNPDGRRDHPKFTRPTCLQGIAVDSFQHTAEEVQLFNQLKPGRYCGRRVEVQRLSDGTINLQWSGQRVDQRMAFYSEFPSISAVLKACIAERVKKEADRKAGVFEDIDAVL